MEEGLLTSEHVPEEPLTDEAIKKRFDICRKCPLFVKDTKICNPSLWYNPDTGAISERSKKGYYKGCGCLVTRKVRNPRSHCPISRW